MFKIRKVSLLLSLGLIALNTHAQWIPLNSGTSFSLYSIQFINDSVGFVTGNGTSSEGIILKTQNQGQSWDTSFFSSTAELGQVFFTDLDTGYAGFGNDIIKTVDGGIQWTGLNDTFVNVSKGLFFVNGRTGYYAVSGAVYKTNDGGSSWSMHPAQTSNTDGIYFFNEDTGIIGGWYNPLLSKTIDGGNNWSVITSQYSIMSLHFPSSNIGYAVGGNIILKTTNAGDSWIPQVSGLDSSQWLFSIYCTDTNNCYAVGAQGIILKTIDGGNTWIQQNSGTTQTLNSIYCTLNNCYAVGGNGVILKTIDGEVGIHKSTIEKKSEIIIAPNPSNAIFNLETGLFNPGQLYIYNSVGETVFERTIYLPETKINLSSQPDGIYFLRIKSGDKYFFEKLVITR